jgi:transcriptional regulator with XRE-family HTH domain
VYITDYNKIKYLVSQQELTYAEFAEKVGATYGMIGHILSGIKQPGVGLLKRMADYFNLTADDLIIKVNPPSHPS